MFGGGIDQLLSRLGHGGRRALLGACLGLIVMPGAQAHPDLLAQIEALDQRIAATPADAGLLLRRGDLHRRHADWAAAERDFLRARELQPDHPELAWLYGRMLVEAGRPAEGEAWLDAFVMQQPGHSGARAARARARAQRGAFEAAAGDYLAAIEAAERPAPALYSRWIEALLAVPDHPGAARAADDALAQFPGEVGLTALAVDIALARADHRSAQRWLLTLPAAVRELSQWSWRTALAQCLQGDLAGAGARFGQLDTQVRGGKGAATWKPDRSTLSQLARTPSIPACQEAASRAVSIRRPH